ncbi:tyrosinase family protein [Sinorhizobium meliloti]|uniref:tyrosinase family protein n=1 Tax=Rhizobium meliloti TaxID=382 RepID=UPI000FD96237|nr:tyrosinase family protein [Sinorhizobium meliloti]RVM19655.1 tyrosinase family protein [Sinorhizobium meliloti]RVO32493.1 tyrosinase family protein [Sinorhizobium meliloti]
MKRRDFLMVGLSALAAPYIVRAQPTSSTPVFNGKRVRRRLSTLNDDDPFFSAYGRAIELMHQEPETSPLSWVAQARIHADYCEHGTLEFFPWHRPYLSLFERICGALIGDASFALPYWHWGDNNGRIPAPFFANGPLNIVSWNDSGSYVGQKWGPINTVPYRYARADFGLKDGPLAGQFTDSALRAIESAPSFDLLSGLTENPHGTVHVFVGGNPNFNLGTQRGHFSSGLSPLDPIFWLHHANVDRIWAQSPIAISDQTSTIGDVTKTYSGMFFDENKQPVSAVLGSVFDINGQDYTYDFLVPEMQTRETRAMLEQIISAQPQLREFAQARGIKPATGEPAIIGSAVPTSAAVVGAINRINVPAENVANVITTPRVVSRPLPTLEPDVSAIAVEGGRVYARFTDVQPAAAAEGNSLKVFVNCPYLSDATPTTDPHFAGAISFFGCSPEVCGVRNFTVDVTEPLRFGLDSGALSPKDVQVQLLSFSGEGAEFGATVAKLGKVELISS